MAKDSDPWYVSGLTKSISWMFLDCWDRGHIFIHAQVLQEEEWYLLHLSSISVQSEN